jgi:predicted nucleic acid-binding protein
MAEIFVDTSGWASLLERAEPDHAEALACLDRALQNNDHLVTTNFVLIELTALLTSPLRIPKPRQIHLLHDLQRDPMLSVVRINDRLESDAWTIWQDRPDKTWSLVDCSSFVLMEQRRIQQALTTDHHFEQAGFVRLLT